jgi:hypothetical protein
VHENQAAFDLANNLAEAYTIATAPKAIWDISKGIYQGIKYAGPSMRLTPQLTNGSLLGD